MQQVERYNELYLTEKEKKIDVERELMDCKVIMFSMCSSFLLSVFLLDIILIATILFL